jgi:signal transduction histidine kinase
MEPSATTGTLRTKLPRREPAQVFVLAALGLLGTTAILLPNLGVLADAVVRRGAELLLWSLLIVVVNLFFHFENRSLQFTLDIPLVLAAAALYEPVVVAALALASEVDVREVERRVSIPRAIFNRTQISISAFAASTVFHAVGGLGEAWPMALAAMGLAWGTFYVLNAAFVTTIVSIREATSLRVVIRSLALGRPVEYVLTYLGYGIFALVLARLFREVGPWAVVLFLIPLFVAHGALVRAEMLQAVTRDLRDRERLMELLSARMAEERKDERLRIASDLHDEVLQDVTRIWMQSGFARDQCKDEGPLATDLQQLVSDSKRALASLRSVISDLKKSPLGRGGLVQTAEQLVRDLRLDWGRRIEFQSPDQDLSTLSSDIQLVTYQVIREGLINALKHSNASSIIVMLALQESGLEVFVQDDGIGFDPTDVDTSNHFGLGLIRERVQMVGGELRIRTDNGQGCELGAWLPNLRGEEGRPVKLIPKTRVGGCPPVRIEKQTQPSPPMERLPGSLPETRYVGTRRGRAHPLPLAGRVETPEPPRRESRSWPFHTSPPATMRALRRDSGGRTTGP